MNTPSTCGAFRNEPAPAPTDASGGPAPVASPSVPTAPRLYPLAGLLVDLKADALARYEAKQSGTALGALSGLPLLDDRLGGSWAIGTHIVHGSPGVGKTAFALQVAACCGCPALFVTCEVLPVELLRRHTARVTGTFLGKFKDGSLSPDDVLNQAHRAVVAAPMLALLDGTAAPLTSALIVEAAATVRGLAPDNPHLLIVVDSLHTWADTLGQGEEYDRLNAAIAALRTVAVQEKAAVLCVAERNKASMGKGGQNSGAGTRKIEYAAETVIGLQAKNTDDDGSPVYDTNGETEVLAVLGKNRHGEAGKPLRLLFSGRCQRYRPAEGEAAGAAPASVGMSAGLRVNAYTGRGTLRGEVAGNGASRSQVCEPNGKGKP